MNDLSEIIRKHILQHGPITVADYWELCLAHPQHGYYMKQDPFGQEGDFITAPEISQMFGEMIGIWVADLWLKMGSPAMFVLTECGAGRGTMMQDLLRATRAVPGFHAALDINIVETSPHLRAVQKQNLTGYTIHWHDTLATVSELGPLVILGNEFFDALPIRQVVRADTAWRERMIGIDGDGLGFGLGDEIPMSDRIETPIGSVFEFSPARDAVWTEMTGRIRLQGGAALMIDYGHAITGFGDTLQAVKDHAYANILETPGEADLTSHVNFERLKDIAKGLNPRIATQGDFLRRLGIQLRAQTLSKTASTEQAAMLKAGLDRLIEDDQMGTLFKVLSVCNPVTIDPAGFHD